MDERQQLRSEAHKYLHQMLMQLYQSYQETLSPDEARTVIANELDEMKAYFYSSVTTEDALVDLEELRRFWLKYETHETHGPDASYFLSCIPVVKDAYQSMQELQN